MEIRFILDDGALPPTKAYAADAGWDLYAAQDRIALMTGTTVDTGVHILIPEGYVGVVTGRSGLNFRDSVIVPQGTIDPGYTGSIKVRLYAMNHAYEVKKGNRIAQLLIIPREEMDLVQVDSLPNTRRGKNGFGSTGR